MLHSPTCSSCNSVILWCNLLKHFWPLCKSPLCFQRARVFADVAETLSSADSYSYFPAESTADSGRAARTKDPHSFQRLRGSGQSSGLWQTCWQTLDQAVSGWQGGKAHPWNTPIPLCLRVETAKRRVRSHFLLCLFLKLHFSFIHICCWTCQLSTWLS